MITVLSESEPVARKEHNCDACDFILGNGYNGMGYTFSEMRAIAKAKANYWKIVKGEKYIRQANVCDGEFYTFKAIPAIHAICLKYDLYEM